MSRSDEEGTPDEQSGSAAGATAEEVKEAEVPAGREGAKNLGKTLYVPQKRTKRDEERDNRRLKEQFKKAQVHIYSKYSKTDFFFCRDI